MSTLCDKSTGMFWGGLVIRVQGWFGDKGTVMCSGVVCMFEVFVNAESEGQLLRAGGRCRKPVDNLRGGLTVALRVGV